MTLSLYTPTLNLLAKYYLRMTPAKAGNVHNVMESLKLAINLGKEYRPVVCGHADTPEGDAGILTLAVEELRNYRRNHPLRQDQAIEINTIIKRLSALDREPGVVGLPPLEGLARRFSRFMCAYFQGGHEMGHIITRNRQEQDPDICHSHDFCDANMFMADAWDDLCPALPLDVSSEVHCQRFNDAWTLAKKHEFFMA